MSTASAAATAVTFVWLGMVLAISFLEAPLKFRAPGVDLRTGLAIGRLVFRALNVAEALLAIAALMALVVGGAPGRVLAAAIAAVVILAIQVAAVRPLLSRRSDRVLAAPAEDEPPRSRVHLVYVALEIAKVAALIVAGALILAA
jgi:hypothetical protein